MFQDAAYICDAINAFNLAEKNIQGKSLPDFALFYRDRSEKYKSYHSSYFDSKWKITDPTSVKMDPATATYVAYEMKLAEHNPKFLAIASSHARCCGRGWLNKLSTKCPRQTLIALGLTTF